MPALSPDGAALANTGQESYDGMAMIPLEGFIPTQYGLSRVNHTQSAAPPCQTAAVMTSSSPSMSMIFKAMVEPTGGAGNS